MLNFSKKKLDKISSVIYKNIIKWRGGDLKVNRRRLVDAIAKETGFSKKDSALALNTVLNTIANAVSRKERVILMGFGTFYTVTRQPRKARNPRTGAMVNIPKRTVPRWRASPEFQSKVK